ncbi:MAG: alpha-1,2-fucosyltransferase [Lachnospiraceae bacterium]
MLIIRLQGGLGNQLYQYALYLLLKEMGKHVKLDGTDYTKHAKFRDKRDLELSYFTELSYELCTYKERLKYVDDRTSFFARLKRKIMKDPTSIVYEEGDYMPEIFAMEDGYLSGWWNNEKYYHTIIPLLQEKIVFPNTYNKETKEWLEVFEKQKNAVSVHIRMGDYIEKSATYGGICTKEYYESAIKYMKEQIKDPIFYLFSDDPMEAKKILPEYDFQIIDVNHGKDSMFDMLLMSKCSGNICANSTFSIWGARLNTHPDKIVIKPLKHDNDQIICTKKAVTDWKNWVVMKEDGEVIC